MDAILMNKDKKILRLDVDEQLGHFNVICQIYDLEYMPVGIPLERAIPSRARLYKWWAGRSIPASREGLEEVLFRLNITSPQELIMKSLGLSLSDQYWLKPTDSDLSWDKVNFFTNNFSTDVGDAFFSKNYKEKINFRSPDNTSDGWLKKKWVAHGSDRYLLKMGSKPFNQEPFNEMLATKMLARLDCIPFVRYDLFEDSAGYCSSCKNFVTPDTELVPGFALYQSGPKSNHISEYTHILQRAEAFAIPDVKDFIDSMIVFDSLILNADRHWGNFGFLRNVETLKFEGPAPLFDNGTSMWCTSVGVSHDFAESKPFKSNHAKQLELVDKKIFERFDLSKLKGIDEEWHELLKLNPHIDDTRRHHLVRGLNGRIDRLQRHMDQQKSVRISRGGMDF